jgi:DNA-binding CsgD family transcriptional regulator
MITPLLAGLLIVPFVLAHTDRGFLRYGYEALPPLLAVVLVIFASLPNDTVKSWVLSGFLLLLIDILGILGFAFAVQAVRQSGRRGSTLKAVALLQALPSLAPALGVAFGLLFADARSFLSLILTTAYYLYIIGKYVIGRARSTRGQAGFDRGGAQRTRASASKNADKLVAPTPQQVLQHDFEAVINEFVKRYRLTAREQEVLLLLGRGYSSVDVARELVVSENTARSHIKNIYHKCGISSRREILDLING